MLPKRSISLLATCLALLTSSSALQLGIKQGKLSITSPDGLADASYSLKPPEPVSPITLSEGSTLKLSFSVVDTISGEAVWPQQAHLLFEERGEEDVTLPVNVKTNGKGSFTLNTAKLPPALSHTRGTSNLTLLLSSLGIHTPLAYPLGHLTLPPALLRPLPRKRHDLPPRQGEPAFAPQEELAHTFRGEERGVNGVISLLGVGVVLAPWAVLLGLVSQLRPSLRLCSPSAASSAFLLTLAALELLIAVYWVGLKLYHLLPAFMALAGVSAYTGKVALGGIREKRIRSRAA